MSCPRCGFSEPGPVECPRCGVVFAKLDRPARPAPAPPEEAPSPSHRRFSWLDAALVFAALASVAVIVARGSRPPSAPKEPAPVARPELPVAESPVRAAREPERPAETESFLETPGLEGTWPEPDVEDFVPSVASGSTSESGRAGGPSLPPEDADLLVALSRLVAGRDPVDSSHVDQAEALHARHPDVPDVGRILEEILERAARQALETGRTVTALRYRTRATDLLPERLAVWRRLIAAHEEGGAWAEVERAARRGLSALPDESWLHLALARALGKQGRDAEAADVLRRRLAGRDDEAAGRELARLEKELQSVAGLAQRRSSHFTIRFEGEADDALGEALLKVLEEKYDMLARTLDGEPSREIPVVLYPRETYRSVSSAPEWAGAYYSRSDARIRIGTRDLSPGFVPLDLERTLTHELAHAFIHARSRGAVPDEINEGLAQYLSGRRLGYRLDPRRAEVLDGRMKVDDFYDSALSFVEYLIERHRQSSVNDLLKYAGETGSVEEAFRRAYHQSFEETRAEWLRSLQ